jgi:23S rRNA pseudouridine2605 synthase
LQSGIFMNKKPARPGKSGFRQDKSRTKGGNKPFRNSSGDKNKGTFNAKPALRRQFDNDSNGGGGGFRKEGGLSERPPFRKRFDSDSNGGGGFRKEGGNSERPPFRKRFDSDSNGGGGFRKEGGNSERPPFRKRFDSDSNGGGGGFRKEGGSQRGGNNQGKGVYWWKDIPEGYERNSKSASPRRRTQNNPRTPDYDMSKIKGIGESKGVKTNPVEGIRLNRFIANAGICSRREADTIIASGRVMINGKVITEMGYRVKPSDRVELDGEILKRERLVYVLLNKPKDFITTTDDPQERKTVMELVKDACEERIYPVGRLDRNTTGLLLLTNDGALAEKLSHPSNQVKKNYQLELNKPLEESHFDQIVNGIELEDGFIKPDKLSYMTDDRMILSIDIHSGRNRIVRRIFEHFGYDVVRLDRATYAGLTKKGLPRGQWRYLTQQEVIRLKFFTGKNKKTTSED